VINEISIFPSQIFKNPEGKRPKNPDSAVFAPVPETVFQIIEKSNSINRVKREKE